MRFWVARHVFFCNMTLVANARVNMTSIARPEAGFFQMSLVKGGQKVGIRIWYGQPLEPDTREVMDRSLSWNAECNGRHIDFDRVWPQCVGDPISEDDYRYYAEGTAWAIEHEPDDPRANPGRRTDWLTAPEPF